MTLRTELVSALPGDLFTVAGSDFIVVANNVYWDRVTRIRRQNTEIGLTWGGRSLITEISGRLILSQINIELFVATPDYVVDKDRRIEDKIETTARTIIENYDNNNSTIAALTTCIVDSVRCFEKTAIDVFGPTPADPRTKFVQQLGLEILAWEGTG